MHKLLASAAAVCALAASSALAAPFTTASPNGELPSGVTEVGGIVFDAIGANGARLTSQLAASSLFSGNTSGPELTIGRQGGYDSSILGALGGGITQLAVRITLFDGDSAPGEFDFGDNVLTINGFEVGNFSDVTTISTDSMGAEIGGSNTRGFADGELDTGFFLVTDSTVLNAVFAALSNKGELTFGLVDRDGADQFFDFQQGIDGSLLGVGSGPVVSAVPVPMAALLFGPAVAGVGLMRRRKQA